MNDLEIKIKKELSPNSTLKHVCTWMRRNRIACANLDFILNTILDSNNLVSVSGRHFNSSKDKVIIMKDCNKLFELTYRYITPSWGFYNYPKGIKNVKVVDLVGGI